MITCPKSKNKCDTFYCAKYGCCIVESEKVEKLARIMCRKYHRNEEYTGQYPELVEKGWEKFIPQAIEELAL